MDPFPYLTMLMRTAISRDRETQRSLSFVLEGLDFQLDPKVTRFLEAATTYYKVTGGSAMTSETGGEYAQLIGAITPLNDPSTPVYAVHQLRLADKESHLSSLLLKAMEMLKMGGPETGQSGVAPALNYLYSNLPEMEAEQDMEESDSDPAQDYLSREGQGRYSGLPTGYTMIDETTDGQQKGELWIVSAYTGQGKSFLLQNIAYNRRMLGMRGIYWTTEQHVSQVDRRLLCRHSHEGKFGIPGGIKYNDIKRGKLGTYERDAYLNQVIPDWKSNLYPELIVKMAPAGTGLTAIMRRTEEIHRRIPLDYMVIDYLSQLRPTVHRSNEREIQTWLFIEAKALALNFNGKAGIPLLTAAQINSLSFISALDTGTYNIRSVAETSEAEKSADFLMYLLRRPEEVESRLIKAGILKYRDGESDVYFSLEEDFSTSYVGNKDVIDSEEATWTLNV